MSVPPVRAGKAAADAARHAARSDEKKPPRRRPKAEQPERPETAAAGDQALFNLFAQIRWPDLELSPDASGKAVAATAIAGLTHAERMDDDEEDRGTAQPIPANAPPPVSMPESAVMTYAQAAPRMDDARLQELHDLMQKLAARVSSTGEGSGFVVSLSHPLFAGTSLAVRMRNEQLEVDYQSSEAAEADWFADNADALTQRIESTLKRRVHMRRKPDEPES